MWMDAGVNLRTKQELECFRPPNRQSAAHTRKNIYDLHKIMWM